MKTTISYLVAQLLAIKQRISRLTNEFYNLVKKYKIFKEEYDAFLIRSAMYEEADSMKKLRWFLALFVVTPILILIDYASVYLFIEALVDRIPSGFGKSVIHTLSLVIFFVMELATILAILRIDEILETHSKSGLRLLKYVLMITMIVSPALLIYAGFYMQPAHSLGEGLKTLVLMMVSLVIHTIFFLLMEDVLHGVNYTKYLISKSFWKIKNPEPRLVSLKEYLRNEYNKYDLELLKISSDPDAVTYLLTIELSKREKFLKERLEDDIDDNDYDEFIDTKRFTPKPPVPVSGFSAGTSSSSTSFSSTVW